MDIGDFVENCRLLDLEINQLASDLDTEESDSERRYNIERNLKLILECKQIEAKNVLEFEKLKEEQRQFDRKLEYEEANFDAKREDDLKQKEEELKLAQAKLEEERRQAEQRHSHDVAELEEERRHNLRDEALRIKAEHDRNMVTAGGIAATVALAALIYVGEMKGGVISSGATSILRLVRFM